MKVGEINDQVISHPSGDGDERETVKDGMLFTYELLHSAELSGKR